MRSSVPGPVGASVGLSGGSDEHGHDDDPDGDTKNHAEREADHELQHCAANLNTCPARRPLVDRLPAQHRSQSLDVGLGHVGEFQSDVKPGLSARFELDKPDDLGPAANSGAVG